MTDLKTLKRLFDFTDDDLAVNRAGKLSERQRTLYRQMRVTAKISKWLSILMVAFFLLTFVIYIGFSITYGNQLGPLVLVGTAIWLGLVYLVFRLTSALIGRVPQHYQRHPDHRLYMTFGKLTPQEQALYEHAAVQQATGLLNVQSDGEHEHLMLGDFELTLDAAADNDERLWKLKRDKTYTVYYIPDPLWIIAIEPA
ncbi:MAG: hypothetical protein LCI00_22840 [Chloroflexi bacterium]|nr:hypothetical protein [Chloroflexota bacterium]MCC6895892.1 hypothetical protein [Anaerolineae bacterium]